MVPDARHGAADVVRAHASHRSPTRRQRPAHVPEIVGAHLEGPFLGGAPGAHRRELIVRARSRLDRRAARRRRPHDARPRSTRRRSMRSGRFRAEGVVVSLGHSTAPRSTQATAATDAGAPARHAPLQRDGRAAPPGAGSARRRARPTTASRRRSSPTSSTCTPPPSDSRSRRRGRAASCSSPTRSRGGAASRRRHAAPDDRRRAPPRGRHARRQRADDGPRGRKHRPAQRRQRSRLRSRAASTDPARLLGLVDRGAIEVGKRADLVALDADLRCAPRGSGAQRSTADRSASDADRVRWADGHRVGAFVESFNMRPAPGPSTRIDITGAFFSMAAPAPVPVTIEPHLLVLVRCRPRRARRTASSRSSSSATASKSLATCQPFTVEPGQVHLPPRARRARVRRVRHGRRALPARPGPDHRRPLHPAPAGLRIASRMPFAAALSEHPLATHAIGEVVGDVLEQLGSRPPKPSTSSPCSSPRPTSASLEDVAATVRALLHPRALLGRHRGVGARGCARGSRRPRRCRCSRPAGAAVPIGLTPVRLDDFVDADGVASAAPRWPPPTGSTLAAPGRPVQRLPGDAARRARRASGPTSPWSAAWPRRPQGPGGNRLVLDGQVVTTGRRRRRPRSTRTRTSARVVSQGCRPIGEPLIVTKSERNILYEIGGEPRARPAAGERRTRLPPEDRALASNGLHLGRVVDESQGRLRAAATS